MQKILLTVVVVLMNVAFFSLPAGAQPVKLEYSSAQDLLIKS